MFEGIAHEALSECMRSLQSASDAIKSKKVNNYFATAIGIIRSSWSICLHQMGDPWTPSIPILYVNFVMLQKPVDAQLFLIKHLLILREQIAAFDVDFAVKEVSLDWTRTKGNPTNNVIHIFMAGFCACSLSSCCVWSVEEEVTTVLLEWK